LSALKLNPNCSFSFNEAAPDFNERGGLKMGQESINVVGLLPTQEDRSSLSDAFHHCTWRLELRERLADSRLLLNSLQMGVVITACNLPDANWKDVLRETERKPANLPLIVACRLADDRLWAEVLNLGGYDVLQTPFDRTELFRSVSLAWRQSRDRWVLASGSGRTHDSVKNGTAVVSTSREGGAP
jgi:DNA-binding response OmpR family regulator